MQNITVNQAVDLVQSVKCTAVSLDIETEPKMRVTENPFIGVKKINTISGLIGFIYENSCNNQLGREDKPQDFVPQARKWGVLDGNVVRHDGKVYVQIKVQASDTPVYMLNGRIIDKGELTPFLVVSKKPHTQDNLEKQVVVRDVNMDNVRAIRMLGEEYIIGGTVEQESVATATATEEIAATV